MSHDPGVQGSKPRFAAAYCVFLCALHFYARDMVAYLKPKKCHEDKGRYGKCTKMAPRSKFWGDVTHCSYQNKITMVLTNITVLQLKFIKASCFTCTALYTAITWH